MESILKRYTISGEDELVDMDEDDIVTFDENAFLDIVHHKSK